MHNEKWGLVTTWLGWCGNSLKTDKWPSWTFRQTRAYIANLALHDIIWGFDGKLLDANAEPMTYRETGAMDGAATLYPDTFENS